MMKHYLMGALLAAGCGLQANAQSLPTAQTVSDAAMTAYIIGSYNRGGYLSQSTNRRSDRYNTYLTAGDEVQHIDLGATAYWYFTQGTAEGSLVFHNMFSDQQLKYNDAGHAFTVETTGTDVYAVAVDSKTYTGAPDNLFFISGTSTVQQGQQTCIDAHTTTQSGAYDASTGGYDPRPNDWNGTSWKLEKAPGLFVGAQQGLNFTAENGQKTFSSKLITLQKATKKLRFVVLNTANGAVYGNYPYFSLGEFKLYKEDGTQVTLSAQNFTSNAAIASGDGIGLAGLCDNNLNTYCHTTYPGRGNNPGDYHYIEVTLPEVMSSFKFDLVSRPQNTNNMPTLVQVLDDDAIAQVEKIATDKAKAALQAAYNIDLNFPTGTGYGQYNSEKVTAYTNARTEAKTVLDNTEATKEQYVTATTALNNAISEARNSINLPQAGAFLRIKSKATGKYLAGSNATSGETERAAFIDADNGANTLFYYTADNKLVAYSTGYKAENNSSFLGYNGITDGTIVNFSKATDNTVGAYSIAFKNNGRQLYAKDNYTDAAGYGSTHSNGRYNYELEAATCLPVTVSEAGVATLFTPVTVNVPDNVKAYAAAFSGEQITLTEYKNIIPANTGVIIEAAKGTYNFNFASESTEEAISLASELSGSVLAQNINTSDNAYVLAKNNDVLGFYLLGTTDRAVAGSRAYYVATAGNAAPAFFFNGGTTTAIKSATVGSKANAVFDLAGRRVQKATKGLYIVNGKKVLVK